VENMLISVVALMIALLSLLSNFEKFSKFVDVWWGILRGKKCSSDNCKYLEYADDYTHDDAHDIFQKKYKLAYNLDNEIPSSHIFVFLTLRFFSKVDGTYNSFRMVRP